MSTGMATAEPPASRISRATVEIVDEGELGSGGKGRVRDASDVLFAATTTGGVGNGGAGRSAGVPRTSEVVYSARG